MPDASAFEFGPICNVFKVVAEKIGSELPIVEISAVMAEVETLLNKSIAAGGYVMPPVSNDPARYIDLSQIDFDALKSQFDSIRQRNYRIDRSGDWGYRLLSAQAAGVSSASR